MVWKASCICKNIINLFKEDDPMLNESIWGLGIITWVQYCFHVGVEETEPEVCNQTTEYFYVSELWLQT